MILVAWIVCSSGGFLDWERFYGLFVLVNERDLKDLKDLNAVVLGVIFWWWRDLACMFVHGELRRLNPAAAGSG